MYGACVVYGTWLFFGSCTCVAVVDVASAGRIRQGKRGGQSAGIAVLLMVRSAMCLVTSTPASHDVRSV